MRATRRKLGPESNGRWYRLRARYHEVMWLHSKVCGSQKRERVRERERRELFLLSQQYQATSCTVSAHKLPLDYRWILDYQYVNALPTQVCVSHNTRIRSCMNRIVPGDKCKGVVLIKIAFCNRYLNIYIEHIYPSRWDSSFVPFPTILWWNIGCVVARALSCCWIC